MGDPYRTNDRAPYDRVRDRYHNDPAFHAVVTMLQRAALDMHLTPSEVREAAMLACILIEERRPGPFRAPTDGDEAGR